VNLRKEAHSESRKEVEERLSPLLSTEILRLVGGEAKIRFIQDSRCLGSVVDRLFVATSKIFDRGTCLIRCQRDEIVRYCDSAEQL
jgi:hypothetical protein